MKTIKVIFIDNCSHGYYSVLKKDFLLSGLKPSDISGCSGMTLNRVYLEEDEDASKFFNACKDNNNNIKVDVKRSYNPKFAISHNYDESLFDYVPMVGDVVHCGVNKFFITDVNSKMLLVCTDTIINLDSRQYRIPLSNLFKYVSGFDRNSILNNEKTLTNKFESL